MRNDQDIGRFPVIGLPLAFENVIGCSLGFNKKFGCIALATTAIGVCLLTHFHFRHYLAILESLLRESMFAKAGGTIICMGWVVSGDLKVVGVSQRVGNRVFKITSKIFIKI